MFQIENNPDRFLPLDEVIKLTGLSRSTIYLWIKNGDFPKSIKIGSRKVLWQQSEIVHWMEQRINLSK